MPDKVEKLTITARSKEINAIISFINIVYNNKEGYVDVSYNDDHSALIIPPGYFQNASMKREDVSV